MDDQDHEPVEETPDWGQSQDVGVDNSDQGQSQWAAPDGPSVGGDQFDHRDPLGFDEGNPALTHGGLDVHGLTLPASLTDPTAQPGADPNSVSPAVFEPVPPAAHPHHSTIGEKVYDALTNPSLPAAPTEDPVELERERQEQISKNAIGQHTAMTPEISL